MGSFWQDFPTARWGGSDLAGNALKEKGPAHWYPDNSLATNSSGFTALQSGYREHLNGNFYRIDDDCWWWSSTESSVADAYFRSINNTTSIVNSHYDNKQLGFSVRCLKD